MSGLFISFEGLDGSGKTTQIKLLEEYFNKTGLKVMAIREPGGTKIGEDIRKIILDNKNFEMSKISEVLLYAASRAQIVKEVINPALENGTVVISDRFVDSSIVYQGFARKLDINMVKEVNRIATGGLIPDMTILLDIPYELALQRKKVQKELDRLENESINFYKEVYKGYLNITEENKHRIKKVDATKSIAEVQKEIILNIKSLGLKI